MQEKNESQHTWVPVHFGGGMFPTAISPRHPSTPYATGYGLTWPSYSMDNVWGKVMWGGNLFVKSALTCLGVVAVASPLKTLTLRYMGSSKASPPPGPIAEGLVQRTTALYAGTRADLNTQAIRSGYIHATKDTKSPSGSEKISEKSPESIAETTTTDTDIKTASVVVTDQKKKQLVSFPLPYVAFVAAGDIALTQIPESKSTLQKRANFLPPGFKFSGWANHYQLLKAGIEPRYSAAMINFEAISVVSSIIQEKLPFEGKKKSFIAGAISGASAAVITYPLTTLKDYVLLQATLVNGKLHIPSSFHVAKGLINIVLANPTIAIKAFGKAATKQAPTRIAMTATVFSIVNGVGDILGNDPLGDLLGSKSSYKASQRTTLFGGTSQASPCCIEKAPDDEAVSSNDKTRSSTTSAEPPKPS